MPMDIPNGGELPDDATIIFHVSGGKRFPRTGLCEYIDAEALKCDEDGISVTWLEHFPGKADEQFQRAALAMRGQMKVRKSGVVACVRIADLRTRLEADGNSISVVRDELPGNTGHCLIKGVQAEDMGKRLLLARAVTDFVQADAIPDYVND
jgi:hypothetical protein